MFCSYVSNCWATSRIRLRRWLPSKWKGENRSKNMENATKPHIQSLGRQLWRCLPFRFTMWQDGLISFVGPSILEEDGLATPIQLGQINELMNCPVRGKQFPANLVLTAPPSAIIIFLGCLILNLGFLHGATRMDYWIMLMYRHHFPSPAPVLCEN